jgi:isoleucyl-tRNA synthetase
VLALVVERLAGLIAPVLCHMAEDIWQNLPYPVAEASVFERGWPTAPAAWRCPELDTPMDAILALRALVNRQLESCRKQGGKDSSDGPEPGIGASLEAQVQIALADDGSGAALTEALDWLKRSPHPSVDNLSDWLLVSAVGIGGPAPEAVLAEASADGVTVRVARAAGQKCERCWHYETDIGEHSSHPSLCGRCVAVLEA